MRALADRRLVIPLLLALAGSAGCDLFRPADPEPPSGAILIPDYSTPDLTLESIADAVADKGLTGGTTVYAGAFAESTSAASPAGYHHFFWPDDLSRHLAAGNPMPNWGFRDEQDFYNRLVNFRGDRYRLTWAVDSLFPDDVRADVAYVHRHYLLTTESEDGTITNSTIAIGYADLTFLRFPDNAWRIVLWQDRADPLADPADPEAVTLGRRRLDIL